MDAARAGGAVTTLPRFIARTLAWLPVTFIVWYFAAPILLYPALALAEAVLRLGFGDLVRAVGGDGSTAVIVTTLKPGQASGGGQVSVDVNLLLYAFGMPMFAALVLAAREPRWGRILVIGLVAMLPFVAWGVVADFLKNVAITAGPGDRLPDRLLPDAARAHRVRVPVRLAHPAHGRAGRAVGADAPRVPRAAARAAGRRAGALRVATPDPPHGASAGRSR